MLQVQSRAAPAAQKELGKLGIQGSEVHLLDVVPLLEMGWADGKFQNEEMEEVQYFVHEHIDRINRRAGEPVLSWEDGDRFLQRFTLERPPEWLMRRLTSLVPQVSLASDDDELNHARKQAILGGCLDVGQAASGLGRFNPSEKAWYAEVARTLDEQTQNQRPFVRS